MAEALVGGVLSAELANPEEICVGEPLQQRRQYLSQKYGVLTGQDNSEVVQGAELVILAIKPQDLPAVCKKLAGRLQVEQAVLSIVAGAKMSTLSEGLGHAAVIRVMPNTPAQIGEGMSLWACTSAVEAAIRELARSILGTVARIYCVIGIADNVGSINHNIVPFFSGW